MANAIESNDRATSVPVRFDFVEGIRGLSSTYVVMHHVWQFAVAAPVALAPRWFKVATVFKFGAMGVAVFVVVSGFCLMMPLTSRADLSFRGGVGRFAERRARRIIPPYFAALALSFAILGVFSQLRQPTGTPQDITLPTYTWAKTAAHVLLVHNWSVDWRWGINPPHWTVALEFQIYFVFALVLVPLWRRFGAAITMAVAAAISAIPMALGKAFAAPWMLGLFACGMWAAVLVAEARRRSADGHDQRAVRVRWSRIATGGFIAVPVTVVLAGTVTSGDIETLIDDLVIGMATAAGLIALALRAEDRSAAPSRTAMVLTSRPARWLGEISYSTYLVHYPIVAAVAIVGVRRLEVSVPASFLLVLVGSWPIILAVSFAFHRLVERPFSRGRQRQRVLVSDGSVLQ